MNEVFNVAFFFFYLVFERNWLTLQNLGSWKGLTLKISFCLLETIFLKIIFQGVYHSYYRTDAHELNSALHKRESLIGGWGGFLKPIYQVRK